MAVPQPGIFAQGTRSHHHLEFDLSPGATDAAICAALKGLARSPVTVGGSNIVVGFGADSRRRLFPERRARRRPGVPRGLGPGGGGAVDASRHLGVEPRHR